jgi:hypothetical protein
MEPSLEIPHRNRLTDKALVFIGTISLANIVAGTPDSVGGCIRRTIVEAPIVYGLSALLDREQSNDQA